MTGIGVGMAFSLKRSGSRAVVAAMIGDGTLGEGMLYETLNLAAIWQLPMLFVVENNGIAQTTYTTDTIGGEIEARGRAFGLDTWRLSDDAADFCTRVADIVTDVRERQQPGFLVIDTRRLGPHSKGDDLRDAAEKAAIRERDPLAKLGMSLPEPVRTAIEQRNQTYLDSIEEAANASPEAREEAPPENIFAHATHTPAVSYPQPQDGENVRQAINGALRHLLDSDQHTLLLGEDLHDPYGGAFKVTAGLSTDFPGRVVSTPISEAGITGATVGMAVAGMRPVMEVMFADFLTLCMDQLYNHAVKFPGVFPEMQVPLVIRTPSGGRRGYGPTHSQSPENIFTAIPGLTVVYPSHRHAVGRLLVDATQRWLYPTLFFEHKLLYSEPANPGDYRILPAAQGDVAAELFPTLLRGSDTPDISILSYGGMLPVVEQVVTVLEQEEELAVEVLAPSLLSPLPRNTLVQHLLDRPRILVVEETHHEFGVSAEILAALLESGYQGEALRIGTPPVPISAARSLERQILADAEQLINDILDWI
jgi:2-oxoisovalerate dehydrogenase E1 component